MSHVLEAVRLKVERANKHIEELTPLIHGFFKAHPPMISFEDDLPQGKSIVKVHGAKETPPTVVAVIAGEILYLQRSALDHLFTSAVTVGGHIGIKRPNFPVEETRDKFEEAIKGRKIEERFPNVAAALRELKPYKGGNDLLWWLHWLNGAEKHKVLVTIGGAKAFREIKFKITGQFGPGITEIEGPVIDTWWFRSDEDYILARGSLGTKYDPDIQFEMGVSLSEIEAMQFEPIQTTLQHFSDLVIGIANAFETKGFLR